MNEIKTFEQMVPVPGGEVYVKTWVGNASDKAPIFLFHDSLGCVDMWRDFPTQLVQATGRTVIAYDRLGFGRSAKREALPSIRFVNEEAEVYFPAVLKALSVDRFVIFGHSVGGGMAVTCAGTFTERCEAIITESAQAFVEDRTVEGISKAKIDFADPKVFSKLEKYHGEKTQWVLDAWIKVWLSKEFSNWSLENDLPKVKCPLLAIHGDSDEYGSNKFPEMICDLAGGPTQKEIIQDCGHVPHRTKAEFILILVSKFLK